MKQTKIVLIWLLLFSTLILFLFSGCDKKATTSFQQTKVQIGVDTYVEAVVGDISGATLSEKDINQLARLVFQQASLLYGLTTMSPELLELDQADTISAKRPNFQPVITDIPPDEQLYQWEKVRYIKTWSEFQSICERVYSKEYCEKFIFDAAKYRMIEKDGKLYQCNQLTGGVGGNGSIIPTKKKIQVLSQKENEIRIRAEIKDGVALGYDDLWKTGDIDYTLLRQNGFWVLSSFGGTEFDQFAELFRVAELPPSDNPIAVRNTNATNLVKTYFNAIKHNDYSLYTSTLWALPEESTPDFGVISLEVGDVTVDEEKTAIIKTKYRDTLTSENNWDDAFLEENMLAVRAEYVVDYDSQKSGMPEGKVSHYFYLLRKNNTADWLIWEQGNYTYG